MGWNQFQKKIKHFQRDKGYFFLSFLSVFSFSLRSQAAATYDAWRRAHSAAETPISLTFQRKTEGLIRTSRRLSPLISPR